MTVQTEGIGGLLMRAIVANPLFNDMHVEGVNFDGAAKGFLMALAGPEARELLHTAFIKETSNV